MRVLSCSHLSSHLLKPVTRQHTGEAVGVDVSSPPSVGGVVGDSEGAAVSDGEGVIQQQTGEAEGVKDSAPGTGEVVGAMVGDTVGLAVGQHENGAVEGVVEGAPVGLFVLLVGNGVCPRFVGRFVGDLVSMITGGGVPPAGAAVVGDFVVVVGDL